MTDWTDVTHRYLPGGDKPPVLDHVLNGRSRASPSLGEIGDRKALQFHLLTAPFFRTGQETS